MCPRLSYKGRRRAGVRHQGDYYLSVGRMEGETSTLNHRLFAIFICKCQALSWIRNMWNSFKGCVIMSAVALVYTMCRRYKGVKDNGVYQNIKLEICVLTTYVIFNTLSVFFFICKMERAVSRSQCS